MPVLRRSPQPFLLGLLSPSSIYPFSSVLVFHFSPSLSHILSYPSHCPSSKSTTVNDSLFHGSVGKPEKVILLDESREPPRNHTKKKKEKKRSIGRKEEGRQIWLGSVARSYLN